MCLQKEMEKLLTSQLEEWETARNNYDNLNGVKIRTFDFENFQVKVQFNPARIVSSGAKTDTKSIAERKCFCRMVGRPEQDYRRYGFDACVSSCEFGRVVACRLEKQ